MLELLDIILRVMCCQSHQTDLTEKTAIYQVFVQECEVCRNLGQHV